MKQLKQALQALQNQAERSEVCAAICVFGDVTTRYLGVVGHVLTALFIAACVGLLVLGTAIVAAIVAMAAGFAVAGVVAVAPFFVNVAVTIGFLWIVTR